MTLVPARATIATLALGVLAAHAVATARPARATVVQAMPFAAQATRADRVFVGTVTGMESRRTAHAPAYFETLVTFEVEEVVAGALPATLVLRFSGGQVGDEVQTITGMPECLPGERYVIMLEAEHDPPYMSPVIGFNQGIYRVVDEARGAVVRDRQGQPLATADSAAAALPALGGEPTLGAFLDAVREARRR